GRHRARLRLLDPGRREGRRRPRGARALRPHPHRPAGAAALAGLLVHDHRAAPAAGAHGGPRPGRPARRRRAPRPVPRAAVMMRVIDTAATLRARRAPSGLTGTVRLVVEDGTVPEGTCRAAGTRLVTASGGTISVTDADAR